MVYRLSSLFSIFALNSSSSGFWMLACNSRFINSILEPVGGSSSSFKMNISDVGLLMSMTLSLVYFLLGGSSDLFINLKMVIFFCAFFLAFYIRNFSDFRDKASARIFSFFGR